MALDGIVLRAIETEFQNRLIGMKIDKIHQPERDELIMSLRGKGQSLKLLLSASSNNPRAYITNVNKSNPLSPPMFCMLLRKHIQGGIIKSIKQIDLERILIFEIESMDELGIMSIKQIIIEIMNKHSNIILVRKEDNKIIDSIKRVSIETSSLRQVLPNLDYKLPPSQNKENPIDIDINKFINLLKENSKAEQSFKFLYKTFLGMSPLVAREIVYESKIDSDKLTKDLIEDEIIALWNAFNRIYRKIEDRRFINNIVKTKDEEKLLAFSSIKLNQFGDSDREYYDSISEMLDYYFRKRDNQDRIKQKSNDLRKNIITKIDRLKNKVSKQELELRESKNRDIFKIKADLLMANLYKINRGDTSVEVENFYDPEMKKMKINLNPKFSASDNAQKYYKKYNKLKHAGRLLQKQIDKSNMEIEYLQNIVYSIDSSNSIEDIEEIRDELIGEKYLKSYNKSKSKMKKISKPHHFISSDGLDIFVGKNNKQNDKLTMKTAYKTDLWFHTKDIPGSHVILKSDGGVFPENSIREAALLAAHFSKGNMSENVAVDYTERRNVRKPNGAKPGMVIYENNNTIYITPNKSDIEKIKKAMD
ncbi:MAG: NFACT RNA binding domain-containing protein [Andreesenia angusta]|nr:NFACT RNA binding domain-containing protein [Andreesenia angusta]